LGHFIAAKRAGVQVDEFSLGFGPRLLSHRSGETEYALRLIPLGGYVRMAGMYPGADGRLDSAGPRSFQAQGLWRRIGIIAAGPVMNFAVAVVLFATVFGAIGLPAAPTLVVASTEAGYPAAAAGVRPGDRIMAVNGTDIRNWNQLTALVRGSAGRPLRFTMSRDGHTVQITMTPRAVASQGGAGIVGITPVLAIVRLPTVTAVLQAFASTAGIVVSIFAALGALFHGTGMGELMGPVGIGQQISQASQTGIGALLILTAALSADLGLFNLLPVPALDGSRLVFLGIEGLRGRPVDPEKEGFVHLVGFALLVVLMVFVTYHDVLRLTS
jgi:regulator of sigma E protease